tara:strand:+ start:73 stop:435 length:363 start_codon:yes stop_codon:yes gene_type:complete
MLVASRPFPKIFHGFFEFPGGKVQEKEYLIEALKRELFEELSINIELSNTIFLYSYLIKRNSKKVHLNFFLSDKWNGSIKSMEKQIFKWVTIKQIGDCKILSSNKKILKKLEYFSIFPRT